MMLKQFIIAVSLVTLVTNTHAADQQKEDRTVTITHWPVYNTYNTGKRYMTGPKYTKIFCYIKPSPIYKEKQNIKLYDQIMIPQDLWTKADVMFPFQIQLPKNDARGKIIKIECSMIAISTDHVYEGSTDNPLYKQNLGNAKLIDEQNGLWLITMVKGTYTTEWGGSRMLALKMTLHFANGVSKDEYIKVILAATLQKDLFSPTFEYTPPELKTLDTKLIEKK